jgi:hypothetical protein
LIVPETTLSGTGLAGIETSVMESQWDRRKALKIKGPAHQKRFVQAGLKAFGSLPYHLRAGHDQPFRRTRKALKAAHQ